MPDENRFAGIGEAVEGDDESDVDDDPSTTEDGASDEKSADDETKMNDDPTTNDDPAADDASAEKTPSADTAAFAFDDTVQKSVYVRPETFETLEDAEALVNAQLRTEHEIKNLTRREFFDAVFEEAAADTDRLVERIRQMREK